MFAHGNEDLAMFVDVQVTSHRRYLMALEILVRNLGIILLLANNQANCIIDWFTKLLNFRSLLLS